MCANVLKIQMEILHIYSDPLSAITALSLLGYDTTRLSQLYLGSIPSSGWATQGHSETCPEATPVLSWLCA